MQINEGHSSSEGFCSFGRSTAIIISLSSVSFSPTCSNLFLVFLHFSCRYGHCIMLLINVSKHLDILWFWLFVRHKKPENVFKSWKNRKKTQKTTKNNNNKKNQTTDRSDSKVTFQNMLNS